MKVELTVAATLLIAILLGILPIPHWALWARPDWLLLVLVYWVLAFPERYGIFTAAFVGLLHDFLHAGLLGKHAFAYSVVVSITLLFYKRLRLYEPWQQAGFIFLLLCLGKLVEYWLDLSTGNATGGMWSLLPVVMGALFWPSVLVTLRGMRRKAQMVSNI